MGLGMKLETDGISPNHGFESPGFIRMILPPKVGIYMDSFSLGIKIPLLLSIIRSII